MRGILTIAWLCLAAIALLLPACRKEVADVPAGPPLIYGLASPVELDPDTTVVFLSDYVLDTGIVDRIEISGGIGLIWRPGENECLLVVTGDRPKPGRLTLHAGERSASIPVFASKKKSKVFRFDPGGRDYASVSLVGDMNAWNPANTPLVLGADGSWSTTLSLNPGIYGYQVVVDGEWYLDPANPDSLDNGIGGYNSRMEIPQPDPVDMPVIWTKAQQDNVVSVGAVRSEGILAFWQNQTLEAEMRGSHWECRIPQDANGMDRSFVRAWGYNHTGISNDLLIPLDSGRVVTNPEELDRMDKHAIIMYFLMVDRFYNARAENDRPVDDPDIRPQANHLGGDLAGVINQVITGYFDSLAFNTIWLSPIPRNAEGAWGLWDEGGVTSEFSSYHGYWPVSFTEIDPRYGSDKDLRMLTGSLHKRNKNLLLDFVANHVHQDHPVYQSNKDKGWATNLYLPDGSLNTEKWDEQRLTTWFDTFLPTLNLEKPEVTEMLSDSAVYWLEEYGIDGFRHDATKHIPEIFWRNLTRKVKSLAIEQDRDIYQVGETYGTPELIDSYIGSGMLDGQFDFNVYDALANSICRDDIGFDQVHWRIGQSLEYYGSHHLMGNMSGNQDKARIMSLATGEVRFDEDTKLAGWTRDIDTQTEEGFRKVAMMHAFNMTIPGVPVVYYGDEIGMPGGNDPDNRRMMRFEGLSEGESKLRETVAELARIRASRMEFLYGDLHFAMVEEDQIAYTRRYFDSASAVLFNNGEKDYTFSFVLPEGLEAGACRSRFGRECSIENGMLKAKIPAGGFDIIQLDI